MSGFVDSEEAREKYSSDTLTFRELEELEKEFNKCML